MTRTEEHMDMHLVNYDAARQALERVVRVDEAKDIRDKAIALQAYARQAKDRQMLDWVTSIRIRAERRTGELLAEMEKQHGARGKPGPGRGNKTDSPSDEPVLTIKDFGISHNESSLWQKLAGIPDEEFEARLASARMDLVPTTTRRIISAEKSNGRNKTAEWRYAWAVGRIRNAVEREASMCGPDDWKRIAHELMQIAKELEARRLTAPSPDAQGVDAIGCGGPEKPRRAADVPPSTCATADALTPIQKFFEGNVARIKAKHGWK